MMMENSIMTARSESVSASGNDAPLTFAGLSLEKVPAKMKPSDLDEAVLSAMAEAFAGEKRPVVINDAPEDTNIAMPSGSVMAPSRWVHPSMEEIEEFRKRL